MDLRNILKKAFQKHNVRAMSEQVGRAGEEYQSLLQKHADEGMEFDAMRMVACFHLDAIGNVAFNTDLGCLASFEDGENVIEQSFEYLLEELPRRAYAPDWETQNDFESDTADNRVCICSLLLLRLFFFIHKMYFYS